MDSSGRPRSNSGNAASVLQWGRNLVSSNMRQDASTTSNAPSTSAGKRKAPGGGSGGNITTPAAATAASGGGSAVEATVPHWQRAENIRSAKSSRPSTPTAAAAPPTPSPVDRHGYPAPPSRSGGRTPMSTSSARRTPASTPPAAPVENAQPSTAATVQPPPQQQQQPPPSPSQSSEASAASHSIPTQQQLQQPTTTTPLPSPPVVPATQTTIDPELEAQLQHLSKKQAQLEGMLQRNATEFENRERQLVSSLNSILKKTKELGAEHLASPTGRSGGGASSRAAAKLDKELKDLEEELWESESELQRLLAEEEVEGAAVVRLADVIASCEKRSAVCSNDVATALRDAHRVVQLAVEHRDIVKRMPALAVTDDDVQHTHSMLNALEARDNNGIAALLGASQALESLTTVPLPSTTDLQAITSNGTSSTGMHQTVQEGEEGGGRMAGMSLAATIEAIGVTMKSILPGLAATHAVTLQKQAVLEKAVASAQSQLDYQSLTMDEAHQALSQMHLHKTQLLEQLEEMEFHRKQLIHQQDEESEERKVLLADVAKLEKAVEVSKQNGEKYKNRRVDLEREGDRSKSEAQELQRKIKHADERATHLGDQRRQLQQGIEEIESELVTLRRDARNRASDEDERRRELGRVQEQLQALESSEGNERRRTEELKTKVDEAAQQAAKIRRDTDDTRNECENLDRDITTTLPHEVDELRTELQDLREREREAGEELRATTKEVVGLKQKKKDIEGETEVAKVVLLHKQGLLEQYGTPKKAAAAAARRKAAADSSTVHTPREQRRTVPSNQSYTLEGTAALVHSPLGVASPTGPSQAIEKLGEPEFLDASQSATTTGGGGPQQQTGTSRIHVGGGAFDDSKSSVADAPHPHQLMTKVQPQPPLGGGNAEPEAEPFQNTGPRSGRPASRRMQWSRSPSTSMDPPHNRFGSGSEERAPLPHMDERLGGASVTSVVSAPPEEDWREEDQRFQQFYSKYGGSASEDGRPQHVEGNMPSGQQDAPSAAHHFSSQFLPPPQPPQQQQQEGTAIINSNEPMTTLPVDPNRAPLLVTMEPRRYRHPGNGPTDLHQRQQRPFPWQQYRDEEQQSQQQEQFADNGSEAPPHAPLQGVRLQGKDPQRRRDGQQRQYDYPPSSSSTVVSLGSDASSYHYPPQQGHVSSGYNNPNPYQHYANGSGAAAVGNLMGGSGGQQYSTPVATAGPTMVNQSHTSSVGDAYGGASRSGSDVHHQPNTGYPQQQQPRPVLKDRLASIQSRLHDVLGAKGATPRPVQTPAAY